MPIFEIIYPRMPFFSVVIPLYNKERYIGNTIQSILAQTFTDFEIIVVDDCSTDKSLAVVEALENDRIRIVRHEKNSGLSASRNTGIAHAKADYIALIDADDTWKPFFLETINELIRQFPEAGIFGTDYEEFYPGKQPVPTQKNISGSGNRLIPDFFTASAHQPIYCYSSVAFKKEVFGTAGHFDEKITLGEDVDFNIRANSRFALAYSDRVCASYTIFSENQITTANINNKIITDFNRYEPLANEKPSIKTYLDVNRYILAMQFKLTGNQAESKRLAAEINPQNLTASQRFLLWLPTFPAKMIRKIKTYLLQKGIRLTSFRN